MNLQNKILLRLYFFYYTTLCSLKAANLCNSIAIIYAIINSENMQNTVTVITNIYKVLSNPIVYTLLNTLVRRDDEN